MGTEVPWLDVTRDRSVAMSRAAAVLAGGGVVLAPTDTVYGLLCRWDCAEGRERIRRMKGRSAEKPFQMLAESLDSAIEAGLVADERLRRVALALWPGPLTLVAPCSRGGTVGVRVPRHEFLLAVLRRLGSPLAATSANRSGEPPALDAAAGLARLAGVPDLVLDGGPIPAPGGAASTVAELTSDGKLRILRPGPVSEDALRRALLEGPASGPSQERTHGLRLL